MRMIGTLPDEQQAMAFGDYLLTLGIENQVEQGSDGWLVWVWRDEHLERAAEELARFRAGTAAIPYANVASEAQILRRQQQRQMERLRRNYYDVRTRWATPQQWNIPLTLTLIVISAIVAVATGLGTGTGPVASKVMSWLMIAKVEFHPEQQLIEWQGLSDLTSGQVWRAITPIFLHFGIIHLLFNMLWLRDLGGIIEKTRGSGILAWIVLASAVIPNLAQYWAPEFPKLGQPNPLFGGMSGVVYALFGYAWIKSRFEPWLGLYINDATRTIMLGWLVFTMIVRVIPVANTAHFVGLLTGVAIAGAPILWRKWRR
jgi:GlpG protein